MSTRVSRILLGFHTALILAIIAFADLGGTDEILRHIAPLPLADKFGHFGLFGSLALLVDLSVRRHDTHVGRLRIPTGPLVLFGLVILEELSQLAMITRTFEFADLMADVLGIAFFVGVGRWLTARAKEQ